LPPTSEKGLKRTRLILDNREDGEIFLEDLDFWKQLEKEEVEHAALLEAAETFEDILPEEVVYRHLDEMKIENEELERTIEKYKSETPSREEAYQFAYDSEKKAFELHYQETVTSAAGSEKMEKFKKLNEDDKDHAIRIKQLIDRTKR